MYGCCHGHLTPFTILMYADRALISLSSLLVSMTEQDLWQTQQRTRFGGTYIYWSGRIMLKGSRIFGEKLAPHKEE